MPYTPQFQFRRWSTRPKARISQILRRIKFEREKSRANFFMNVVTIRFQGDHVSPGLVSNQRQCSGEANDACDSSVQRKSITSFNISHLSRNCDRHRFPIGTTPCPAQWYSTSKNNFRLDFTFRLSNKYTYDTSTNVLFDLFPNENQLSRSFL